MSEQLTNTSAELHAAPLNLDSKQLFLRNLLRSDTNNQPKPTIKPLLTLLSVFLMPPVLGFLWNRPLPLPGAREDHVSNFDLGRQRRSADDAGATANHWCQQALAVGGDGRRRPHGMGHTAAFWCFLDGDMTRGKWVLGANNIDLSEREAHKP